MQMLDQTTPEKSMPTVENVEPNEESAESPIVTYKTPTGQDVTLSRDALNTYGEAYINQAALSTGKNRIVFADDIVLDDAKERFPDSDTPLIDAYADYVPDASDVVSAIHSVAPEKLQNISEDKRNNIGSEVNTNIESTLQDHIDNNSPAAISQPNGDAAFIVIPSPFSLEDDTFKNTIIKGLTDIPANKFDNITGTSLDWAKFGISHEIAHIKNGDSETQFNIRMQNLDSFITRSPSAIVGESRDTLSYEIRADISAARDFNIVTSGKPPVPQAFADLRIIGEFKMGGDIIDLGGTGNGLNDHNTGTDLQKYLDNSTTDFSTDKTQFTSAYTNTLVRGFIGATTGPEIFSSANNYAIGMHDQNPTAHSVSGNLTKSDFASALAGNDPTRIVSLGSKRITPEDLYASTKVLLDNGQFDHAPDAKINAQRFVSAIERDAPALVVQSRIDLYNNALQNPANQNFLNELHRYYNPEQKIGYLYGGAANPVTATVPTPTPAQ